MKKGFTMIELIFVIVILGILAAVAIPRLAATRDDAEVSKAATNLTTVISDLGAYYTSQGKFASDLKTMTNVQLAGGGAGLTDQLKAGTNKCIKITLKDADATTHKPATLKVENGDDASQSICTKVLANKGVDSIIKGKFKYVDNQEQDQESDAGEVAISGIGVVF